MRSYGNPQAEEGRCRPDSWAPEKITVQIRAGQKTLEEEDKLAEYLMQLSIVRGDSDN